MRKLIKKKTQLESYMYVDHGDGDDWLTFYNDPANFQPLGSAYTRYLLNSLDKDNFFLKNKLTDKWELCSVDLLMDVLSYHFYKNTIYKKDFLFYNNEFAKIDNLKLSQYSMALLPSSCAGTNNNNNNNKLLMISRDLLKNFQYRFHTIPNCLFKHKNDFVLCLPIYYKEEQYTRQMIRYLISLSYGVSNNSPTVIVFIYYFYLKFKYTCYKNNNKKQPQIEDELQFEKKLYKNENNVKRHKFLDNNEDDDTDDDGDDGDDDGNVHTPTSVLADRVKSATDESQSAITHYFENLLQHFVRLYTRVLPSNCVEFCDKFGIFDNDEREKTIKLLTSFDKLVERSLHLNAKQMRTLFDLFASEQFKSEIEIINNRAEYTGVVETACNSIFNLNSLKKIESDLKHEAALNGGVFSHEILMDGKQSCNSLNVNYRVDNGGCDTGTTSGKMYMKASLPFLIMKSFDQVFEELKKNNMWFRDLFIKEVENGSVILKGGALLDLMMDRKPKDYDIFCVGKSFEEMILFIYEVVLNSCHVKGVERVFTVDEKFIVFNLKMDNDDVVELILFLNKTDQEEFKKKNCFIDDGVPHDIYLGSTKTLERLEGPGKFKIYSNAVTWSFINYGYFEVDFNNWPRNLCRTSKKFKKYGSNIGINDFNIVPETLAEHTIFEHFMSMIQRQFWLSGADVETDRDRSRYSRDDEDQDDDGDDDKNNAKDAHVVKKQKLESFVLNKPCRLIRDDQLSFEFYLKSKNVAVFFSRQDYKEFLEKYIGEDRAGAYYQKINLPNLGCITIDRKDTHNNNNITGARKQHGIFSLFKYLFNF